MLHTLLTIFHMLNAPTLATLASYSDVDNGHYQPEPIYKASGQGDRFAAHCLLD
jgi:hypothetical protein